MREEGGMRDVVFLGRGAVLCACFELLCWFELFGAFHARNIQFEVRHFEIVLLLRLLG